MINQNTAVLWLRKWNYASIHLEPAIIDISEIKLLNQKEIEWSVSLPISISERYKSSRCLIRQLLSPLLNCKPIEVPLHSPPNERPYLYNNHGYISFSHSHDSILLGWSMNPIGVDIENSSRSFKARKIQKRFFPIQEQKSLEYLKGENLRQAVLKSWVCKEAAIKWQGKKLSTDLSKWYLDTNSGELKQLFDGLKPRWIFMERRGSFCGLVSSSVKRIHWH